MAPWEIWDFLTGSDETANSEAHIHISGQKYTG